MTRSAAVDLVEVKWVIIAEWAKDFLVAHKQGRCPDTLTYVDAVELAEALYGEIDFRLETDLTALREGKEK